MVNVSNLRNPGMAYVALSRCTNLMNVKLVGDLNRKDAGWTPDVMALQFCLYNRTCGADEMLFISDKKKKLSDVHRREWKEPKWNHIYIDFETYVASGVQKPYYNHIMHQIDGCVEAEMSLFDERWEGGSRCDVAKKTWEYIRDVAIEQANAIADLKKRGDSCAGLVKQLTSHTPTVIGYNLSGFDLHFIVQQYLADPIAADRFRL